MTAVPVTPSLWRYTAIDPQQPMRKRRGELSGNSAAEIRASLRRIGLQVIDLQPVGSKLVQPDKAGFGSTLHGHLHRHLRSRRRTLRAEFNDSLATMLSSGLPLLEAVQTLLESSQDQLGTRLPTMLGGIREQLRSGQSLGQAMRAYPGWFDETEVAIVEAGQHAGNLPAVLGAIAQRQEHSNELGHKLVGALAYPLMVMLVGLGVVVFLSVKTLPQLVKILTDAKVAPPALTLQVMGVGQFMAHQWGTIAVAIGSLSVVGVALPAILRRSPWQLPAWMANSIPRLTRRLTPEVITTMTVGSLALRLSELIRSGVPMVDALRVLAPTVTIRGLRQQILNAAERVERGEELSAALSGDVTSTDFRSGASKGIGGAGVGGGGGGWFSAEFLRLLDIGQASGELDVMLERIGQRYQRQAKRLIDRLATLLEPVVILGLAAMVGTVVMAAILPLLRLQEIIR